MLRGGGGVCLWHFVAACAFSLFSEEGGILLFGVATPPPSLLTAPLIRSVGIVFLKPNDLMPVIMFGTLQNNNG